MEFPLAGNSQDNAALNVYTGTGGNIDTLFSSLCPRESKHIAKHAGQYTRSASHSDSSCLNIRLQY